MNIEKSRTTLIKIFLGVVAIGALVGGYLLYVSRVPYSLERVPAGEIVSSFDKTLVIYADAKIVDSYSLVYKKAGLSQPAVAFEVRRPLMQVVGDYGAYLRANGWNVTSEADPLQKSTFYLAEKNGHQANIAFEPASFATKVTIALSQKP